MQCPNCNTVWPDELASVLKFCGACGAAMAAPVAHAAAAAPAPVHEPGGELRFVTVVFADLAGFTAFAEDRSADDVARIVGDLLQRLGQVVESYGGGVDKFLGDAVVATFGLPNPDPNATRNAVRAGLGMQAAAAKFNETYGLNFGLRVGIHAGEVMFRTIGGSWTVMGDTVNTASRIQSAATPGKVWLSRPVYEEVRRFFTMLPRSAVELKGKKQAVQPYEILEERLTPYVDRPNFVGREVEWEQLMGTLQRAVAARTLRVVVLRGPAGVGKSRLVWELRDWVQKQPEIYRVDLVQYDHSERLPSHGLNTLIRNRFKLPLDFDEDTLLQTLRDQMPVENALGSAGHEELAMEFFAFALGAARPTFNINTLDGQGKWEGTFLEIKRWLEGRSQQTPWIWFLEDVQKGDADTVAFVDWALRVNWSVPALVVITAREEDFSPASYWHGAITRWVAGGQAVEIRLREIDPHVLAEALTSMAGGTVSPALAHRIAEHTEGNPLFATELILLLKERGQLDGTMEWGKIQLPNSIREVMEARIERLGQEGKEVAKRGALMGRRFTSEAVERIWDRPPLGLDNGLRTLRETETVYEEASKLFAGEVEEVFRHGRLHEAVLARIPREERQRWLRELELWALDKLEGLGPHWSVGGAMFLPLIARSREEQGDNIHASLWYEVLAHLYLKSNRIKEGLVALHKALEHAQGDRRLALCSLLAETELFDGQAEDALRDLEGLSEDSAGAITAGAGAITAGAGGMTAVVPDAIRTLRDSLTSDPAARWEAFTPGEARVAVELTRANVLTHLGRVPEAQTAYEAIQARLNALGPAARLCWWLRWGRTWSYFQSELLGDARAAHAVCQQIRQRLAGEDLNRPELAADRLAFVGAEGLVEYHLGHYAEAQANADERLLLAQAQNNPREEAGAWNMKGIVASYLGYLEQSESHYRHSLELSRAVGYRRGEVIALYNLSSTCLDLRELDLATQYEAEYLTLSRATGNRLAEAYAPQILSVVASERGDFVEADLRLQQALETALQNNWPALVAICKTAQAELLLKHWLQTLEPGWLEQALAALNASEETPAEENPGEFYTYLALATWFSGDQAETEAVIQRGRDRIDPSHALDRYWLDLAEGLITGASVTVPLAWFREHRFLRVVAFAEHVQEAVGRRAA